MRLAVVVLAGTFGCYTPAFKDCELACGASDSCPDGQTCSGGVCRDLGFSGACPVSPIDGSIDGSNIDAPGSTPRWSVPVEVQGIGPGFRDPTLSGNQGQMYLAKSSLIYVSNYNPASSLWSPPAVVPEIMMAGAFKTPFLSFDGLSLYLATGVGADDIWLCTRTPGSSTFMGLNPVAALNTPSIETGGATTSNGFILALSSNRTVASNTDLFESTFMASPPVGWRAPVPLTPLNHPTANDGHAVYDGSGLRIVFASDRSGNFDLYMSTRASETAAFNPPQPITDINTSAIEVDPWLSQDGQTLYFSRGPEPEAMIMKSVRLP